MSSLMASIHRKNKAVAGVAGPAVHLKRPLNLFGVLLSLSLSPKLYRRVRKFRIDTLRCLDWAMFDRNTLETDVDIVFNCSIRLLSS